MTTELSSSARDKKQHELDAFLTGRKNKNN